MSPMLELKKWLKGKSSFDLFTQLDNKIDELIIAERQREAQAARESVGERLRLQRNAAAQRWKQRNPDKVKAYNNKRKAEAAAIKKHRAQPVHS